MKQTDGPLTGWQAWRTGGALLLAGLAGVLAGPHSRARGATDSAAITEVSVEHTACYGPCPVYKVTLRRDGTATFVGTANVDNLGTYEAQPNTFAPLARAIERRGFGRFGATYTSLATDLSHTITTVVQGGRRKTVDNYGGAGPQELWEIQTLIDGAVAQARWRKVGDAAKNAPGR